MSTPGRSPIPKDWGLFTTIYECTQREADAYQQLLFNILGARSVKRFHTIPTLKENNLAAHQHDVAWLCYWLYPNEPSISLLMAALCHDAPEQVYGDIPAPAKWAFGIDKTYSEAETNLLRLNNCAFALNELEQWTLDMADRIAGMLECVAERRLGNLNAVAPYMRWACYIQAHRGQHGDAVEQRLQSILNAVQRHWEESHGR